MELCPDGEEDNLLAQDLLANHAARALAGDGGGSGGLRGGLQTACGDLEARDAFVTGDGRRTTGAHGIDEGNQFSAQRLVVSDRQMTHRIAAIRLEAETLGDLARE